MNTQYKHRLIDDKPLGDIKNNCIIGDLFKTGNTDMVIASGYNWGNDPILKDGYLYYYTGPDWKEKIVIDKGQFQLGLIKQDLTGNGFPDLIVAHNFPPALYWYENPGEANKPWKKHKIEENLTQMYHDLVMADVDGDGELELLVSSPFFFMGYYKIPKDPREENWKREIVCFREGTEGLVVQDLQNKDGLNDIMAGPFHYKNPGETPPRWPRWECKKIAQDFRPYCRSAWMKMTDGREGLVIVEGEYDDGKLSYFEYDKKTDKWTEYKIDTGIYFGHTLRIADFDNDGDIKILVGEMAQGGYGADKNLKSRLIIYKCIDLKKGLWEKNVISKGIGTHEAHIFSNKGDGRLSILGKTWSGSSVDLWEPV